MFRKVLYVLGICLLAFAVSPVLPKADAAIKEVDDVYCWNGDLNYPLLTFGMQTFEVLDRSSAYVVRNTEQEALIQVNSILVVRMDDQPGSVSTREISYDKVNGTIKWNGNVQRNESFESRRYVIPACRLVFADQGIC